MKSFLVLIAGLISANAFAISPSCASKLANDAVRKVTSKVSTAAVSSSEADVQNERLYNEVSVTFRDQKTPDVYHVYYTVSDDGRCSGVSFSQVIVSDY